MRFIRTSFTALAFCDLLLCGFLPSALLAQPSDGIYEGATFQGRPFSVTVSGGNVTSWTVSFQCGSTTGTTTVGASCPIVANSFSCGGAICSSYSTSTSVSGTFSGDSVSGSFTVKTTPGFSNCCTLNGTWSATLAPPQVCKESAFLSCGGSDNWSTQDAGSTDEVTAYSCNPWNYTGREYAYVFQPTVSEEVTISLTDLNDDVDLIVLQDSGTGCDPMACIAESSTFGFGDEILAFDAVAGETYYFIIDGIFGNVSSYSIGVACPSEEIVFMDGFESGNTSAWSSAIP